MTNYYFSIIYIVPLIRLFKAPEYVTKKTPIACNLNSAQEKKKRIFLNLFLGETPKHRKVIYKQQEEQIACRAYSLSFLSSYTS